MIVKITKATRVFVYPKVGAQIGRGGNNPNNPTNSKNPNLCGVSNRRHSIRQTEAITIRIKLIHLYQMAGTQTRTR